MESSVCCVVKLHGLLQQDVCSALVGSSPFAFAMVLLFFQGEEKKKVRLFQGEEESTAKQSPTILHCLLISTFAALQIANCKFAIHSPWVYAMSTDQPPAPPASARRRQCVAAAAAATAACLAPLAVLLAVLVLAPSLLPRLLLRPHHVVPVVASAELRLLAFDAAAPAVAYNLSATLRFDNPGGLYTWRWTALRAAPSYAGQRLGDAAALPGITARGAGAGDARAAAWAGTQRVPPGRRARAVAAALARDRAAGWYVVKVDVATVQNGAESDFACVLSFPAAALARNGSGAAVFDGGRCVDAVHGEI